MAQHITVEKLEGGGVLNVQLAAGKGNILSMAAMSELEEVLDELPTSRDAKLVVLSAQPGCFSFGASVEEHIKDSVSLMLACFHRFIRKLAVSAVPFAALVEGPCLGGAFEMALASHFVFATDKARFACPEIKLGVFPPVLAAIGALQLGGPLAERLLLTGAEMSSDDAVACGWLTQKVPDDGALDAVLAWYREQLAPLSAFSLRQAALASRRAGGIAERLGEPLERVERQYLDELAESHDGNEGIEAFLQKRKPKWRNA